MAEGKNTQLSITLTTVDKATAKIKSVNDRLDAITKPTRDFKKALGELSEKSGLDGIVSGFRGVGSAIEGLLSKVAIIGGVAGLAGAALFGLVKQYDDLGDKAERLGVSVDFLAQMRYAAEKAGAPVEALDEGLQTFSVNLGKLSAGTGRMKAFLDKVSPALERQLKGAKSNEAAFYLLAAAMDKLHDPAKRAALAAAAGLGPELAPLLAQGEKGVKALAARYNDLAGSQEDAATKAGAVDDSLHDLKASTDGAKAAIVSGLAPALKVIVERLRVWFTAHRQDIKEWAAAIGERLPGAVQKVVEWLGKAWDTVRRFVDAVGGLKTVALAVGAVLAGPLISAVATLGVALAVSPFGPWLAGLAAVVVGAMAAVKAVKALATAGRWIGEKAAYNKLVSQHTREISDLNREAIDAGEMTPQQVQAQAEAQAANDIANSHAREDADDRRAQAAIDAASVPAADATPSITPGSDISAASRAALVGVTQSVAQSLAAALRSSGVKISVDFANAPKGTRVKAAPQTSEDVDLSVGYQTASSW